MSDPQTTKCAKLWWAFTLLCCAILFIGLFTDSLGWLEVRFFAFIGLVYCTYTNWKEFRDA